MGWFCVKKCLWNNKLSQIRFQFDEKQNLVLVKIKATLEKCDCTKQTHCFIFINHNNDEIYSKKKCHWTLKNQNQILLYGVIVSKSIYIYKRSKCCRISFLRGLLYYKFSYFKKLFRIIWRHMNDHNFIN